MGGGLTIHPADTDGLAEGEQQQCGATADVVVEQLQQVHSSLPADRETDRPQNCFSHSRPSALGWARRATDLGDQGEAQQAAGGADGQQQQLPPAALAQVGGEKVHQRGHQALQAHKLQAETPAERSVGVKGRWAGLGLIPGAGLPRCPGPAG